MTNIDGDTVKPAPEYEYDVALSFAETNGKFVDRVAWHLRRRGIRCYYYKAENKDALLWGQDLFSYLRNIYQNQSRYFVMFISKDYKDRFWTRHEREWALFRELLQQDTSQKYILPFRFDSTPIEGLSNSIHFLTINEYNARKLAKAIIARVRQPTGVPVLQQAPLPAIGLNRAQQALRFAEGHKIKMLALVAAVIAILGFTLKDRFTPAASLARQLYERDLTDAEGYHCKDGTVSPSAGGPGTCSHHGGINYYIEKGKKLKSEEEYRLQAEQISWID